MEEILTSCPICQSAFLKPFLESQDHFLTQERFTIVKCQDCGFLFTNPRPPEKESSRYYESEKYISHDSSGSGLMSTLYTLARHMAVRRKARIVTRHSSGKELLDIGCGTGEFLAYCRKRGFRCTGVEPGEKARHTAIQQHHLTIWEEFLSMPDPGHRFGCITLWHVLEHIYRLNETMERIRELLEPTGILVVAVPNQTSWDATHYGKYWAAYDLPRHIYHFTADTIGKLAAKHHFKCIQVLPQMLDAYYISLLSEKYKTGRSNPLASVVNGFRSNWQAKNPDKGYSSQIYLLSPEIV